MNDIDTIIWDWNGTLLDDTDICIETINFLLQARGLPLLDRQKYLDVFDFPVSDYYQRIGFDFSKEPFKIPALQYIELYSQKVNFCALHKDALHVLSCFKSLEFKQFILSASEQTFLDVQIDRYGIRQYFDGIAGLDNHYAHSKAELGQELIKQFNLHPSNVCLIGDTVHDFKVALEIECQCLLVANGHHPLYRLNETKAPIVNELVEVMEFFTIPVLNT